MPRIARAILTIVLGGLLAGQVVRTAAVASDSSGSLAVRLWPSHPEVLVDRTMAEIGLRAARGQSLTPAILRQVNQVASKAPLAPEPFLIQGALAQVQQDQGRAERLFAAAEAREPRSVAARYFLADRYLRTGRTSRALAEIAVLSDLFPQGMVGFGPALATFAPTPGAVPQLRRLFHSSPRLEPVVLSSLADDAKNAKLILTLWGRPASTVDPAASQWQAKLINALVDQGQFGSAYAVWRRVTGEQDSRGALFNPQFAKSTIPPPFNWALATAGGVVEPIADGQLQVIYFGRSDTILAEQLLLLGPGQYELSMDISKPPGEGGEIAWSLACAPGKEALARLPIDRRGRAAVGFTVPQGCAAQRLRLTGTPGDFPKSQDFSIGKLSLAKVTGA
ncbi:MAG: tetratricopeptide repeat protein [Sphingomicrobium sp.]